MNVELIALWLIRVGGIYFGAPVLEFSTFLEETEDGTIHVLLGLFPFFWV